MKRCPLTACCLIWFGERLMLSQRLKTKNFPGYWESICVKIEPNESIQCGIQREIKEKTGLFVQHHFIEVIDCVIDDFITEMYLIFQYKTHSGNFNNVFKKRTPWQLYTPDEASKFPLMPGILQNLEKIKYYTSN
jgi:8-oxo-dGTP pyrophosphatase MutT (NUDIX family)